MSATLVCLGEAMLRLSPGWGENLETAPFLIPSVGGAELNVAIAAANVGLPSRWVSTVGRNPQGRRIIRHARAFGVDTSVAVVDDPTARTGIYFVEVAEDPRGTTVHYDRAGSAMSRASLGDVDLERCVSSEDIVFTTGITLALGQGCTLLAGELMKRAAPGCRYFEINFRSKLWSEGEAVDAISAILPDVDVLFASPKDITELLKVDADPLSGARALMARYELDLVVMASRDGRVGDVGINRIEVVSAQGVVCAEQEGRIVDPIGAGDAGTGTFIGLVSQGFSVEEAARASVRASAIVQTVTGDVATFSCRDVTDETSPRVRR